MGQQYIGAAVLNKFERLFVQPVGLSILYGDSARVRWPNRLLRRLLSLLTFLIYRPQRQR